MNLKHVAKQVARELAWRLGTVLLAVIAGLFMVYVVRSILRHNLQKIQKQTQPKPANHAATNLTGHSATR
jgi:hypothetical protein